MGLITFSVTLLVLFEHWGRSRLQRKYSLLFISQSTQPFIFLKKGARQKNTYKVLGFHKVEHKSSGFQRKKSFYYRSSCLHLNANPMPCEIFLPHSRQLQIVFPIAKSQKSIPRRRNQQKGLYNSATATLFCGISGRFFAIFSQCA